MRQSGLRRSLPILLCMLALGAPALADNRVIRLATTTSTESSGLLRDLLPAFEHSRGYRVHVIAVGTGKALRMGQDGDVDVVMVHARSDEEKFVAAGHGVNRRDLMYNDFVLVGPKQDPAGVRSTRTAAGALARIAETGAVFTSRGDYSGTHKQELELWQANGVVPKGRWYRAVGQGMEQTLQIAAEMQAYTLTDRATWIALSSKLDLAVLREGDPSLFNPYGIIAVNPKRYPDVNYRGAMALIDWLTSPAGQGRIAAFRVGGEPLFFPSVEQAKRP
jgi:tungstate transport system substrate-binding protein